MVKVFGSKSGRTLGVVCNLLEWPKDAPWVVEGDSKFFWFMGMKCAVIRHPEMGHLCGYVRIPKSKLLRRVVGHGKSLTPRITAMFGMSKGEIKKSPFYKVRGKEYYTSPLLDELSVHGGLTFSGKPRHLKTQRGLWVGFDAAHSMDYIPAMGSRFGLEGNSMYRTMEYMEEECKVLVAQLIALRESMK